MSREGLIPQLQTRGIQVSELKYGQQTVSVYQGSFQNYAVAIKVLTLVPGTDYTQLEKECRTLMSLSHPNILRLYDCFWENNGRSNYFVIVTEWCEKDLAKDMQQRAGNNFPWKEEDLWKLTFEIVGALTYMQEQGISHRDIKPENIFLALGNTAKIGDFGSARTFVSDTEFATLTGTPLYLSPKLRAAYATRTQQVVHNSFKSDVFSLGLTLLSLSLLTPPVSLAKTGLLNEEVQALIQTVKYSDLFKSMLVWMLAMEEDTRCDFKALNLWLEGNDTSKPKPKGNPVCMQCGNLVDLFSATAQCEVVQLYCQPSMHLFCSIGCCKAYLSLGRFSCPQCGVEIPQETVDWYVPEHQKRMVQNRLEGGHNRIEKSAVTEETKQVAIKSQVAAVPKQKSDPICMQCGKEVDRYSQEAECKVVQLYCEPLEHLFCSRECFKDFLYFKRYQCPQCRKEIPEETIAFYLRGSKPIPSLDGNLSPFSEEGSFHDSDHETERKLLEDDLGTKFIEKKTKRSAEAGDFEAKSVVTRGKKAVVTTEANQVRNKSVDRASSQLVTSVQMPLEIQNHDEHENPSWCCCSCFRFCWRRVLSWLP